MRIDGGIIVFVLQFKYVLKARLTLISAQTLLFQENLIARRIMCYNVEPKVNITPNVP
jgi:hypothetical protein